MLVKCRHMMVIFLITTVVVFHVDSKSFCKNARGKPGICVPISTCWAIKQLLRLWPNPPPPQVVQFVELSKCNVFNNITYVCCEQHGITVENVSAPGLLSSQQRQSTQMNPVSTTATITSPTTAVESGSGSSSKILPSIPKSNAEVLSGMAILRDCHCGRTFAVETFAVGHGRDADMLEYPWMALLVYTDGLDITLDCGGSLITDQYVLTAAHCIRRGNKKLVKVRLGVHNVNQDICLENCTQVIQEIDIEEAIYHKDYSINQFSNDIGLIRLISKAIFRSNVRSICLPIAPKFQESTIDRMKIAGWGLVETGQKANILQEADVPVKDNDFCQQIHRLIRITEKHLCAGGWNDVDTCKGDSGGPIFSLQHYRNHLDHYVLYGIVSAGSSKCGSNFPSIYTRVTSYLQWIAGNLRP